MKIQDVRIQSCKMQVPPSLTLPLEGGGVGGGDASFNLKLLKGGKNEQEER
jgi:hypothetical protein